MKKMKLFILLILLSFTVNYSQNISGAYYNNLFYTCKVWGYLKYFHSSFSADANVQINWDDVLLKNLTQLKNITSKQEFNDYLALYFNALGTMRTPNISPVNVQDDLKYNLRTEWFINDKFSISTTNALQDIQNKFRPQDNYYVQKVYTAGNPSFDSDTLYKSMLATNEGYRLLALFRYWNVINYFYPYKNIMDKNWDDVLNEMIPKILNCQDEKSYHYTILELASNLNDTHAGGTKSAIITNDIRGNYYIPVKLKYIAGNTVISNVGSGITNLKAGDIVKKINGAAIEDIRNSLRLISIGSTPASIERNINTDIITVVDKSESVQLDIENENGLGHVSVPLMALTDYNSAFAKNTPAWIIKEKSGKKFGIINMGILTVDQIPEMFYELWNTDALIFDIRNYPNGTMWYLINYLFPSPIFIARFTVPDVYYPGTLYWITNQVGMGDFTKNYTNRIYILFNEMTQSQAEFTVMALEQHPMAVKIGSQTAGADGNVSYLYLPGGITAVFTGLGTFYPDYRPTQRIGIIPDINVTPTIQGIRDGTDELMEAAFNHYFGLTGIKRANTIPTEYSLSQNYPNPFNPATTIKYSIPVETGHAPSPTKVILKVYDLLGREVAALVNEDKTPGNYTVELNGSKLASGVYFYKLTAGEFIQTKKMILLR